MIGEIEEITEGIIEASIIVGQNQVQEQLLIQIGLHVLSAENMTILQETAQCNTSRQRGRTNTCRCSIWMKIRQYYKCH